ncbi:IS200/IS605 family transposase [Saprospiraceae bacterium]|nr:IS200/IS605 family transposase [Saprospiraceae bacterium]
MAAYAQSLHHIIFSTRYREPSLTGKANRKDLYRSFEVVLERYNCEVFVINGTEDHTHFVLGVHPSESIINVINTLKSNGRKYIKQKGVFPDFNGWETGFATFSCHNSQIDSIVKSVIRQEYIHSKESSQEEYDRLLLENGVELI